MNMVEGDHHSIVLQNGDITGLIRKHVYSQLLWDNVHINPRRRSILKICRGLLPRIARISRLAATACRARVGTLDSSQHQKPILISRSQSVIGFSTQLLRADDNEIQAAAHAEQADDDESHCGLPLLNNSRMKAIKTRHGPSSQPSMKPEKNSIISAAPEDLLQPCVGTQLH